MLTADDLFTPEQSGVSTDPSVQPDEGTWLSDLIATCAILGLPTTSWQSGAPERVILSGLAVALSEEDAIISLQAQGGFLDYAASGTVTTIGLNGVAVVQPVTPDPSIPSQNPTGALGWLDALGQSFFGEPRLMATYASGPLAIVNTGLSTLNEVAGGYHTANAATGATYTNTDAISVPPSAIGGAGGSVSGVIIGGVTTTLDTAGAHGLSVGDVVYVTGVLGVIGLANLFAFVTAVPSSTSFQIAAATSGAYTGGGALYKCTTISMAADVIGPSSNAAPGAVTTTVTQQNGVSCFNLTAWSASNFESNTDYVKRLRLSLAADSPNGPNAAYEYFALTAAKILADEAPPVTLTNGPIVKAITFVTPATNVTTTVVSSSTPASTTLGANVTPGCALLPISSASNASPIVIGNPSAHGLATGDSVTIAGVLGNTAANGGWTITVTSPTSFSLNGSTGSGAYTGGGFVNGGDLGAVDTLLRAKCVPDGTDSVTESSLAFPVTVVATVVVPQAYAAGYAAVAATELAALVKSFPIGGNVPPGGSVGTVPYSAIEGALIEAGVLVLGGVSYVRQVSSLTVNGGTVDLSYPTPNHDAQLAVPAITVIGV